VSTIVKRSVTRIEGLLPCGDEMRYEMVVDTFHVADRVLPRFDELIAHSSGQRYSISPYFLINCSRAELATVASQYIIDPQGPWPRFDDVSSVMQRKMYQKSSWKKLIIRKSS
jgi:hypothetical protein